MIYRYACWPPIMMLSMLIWLLASPLNYINGQSQNAIGAHRSYQRTSFSCSGRPSGYYADIETGCQVYHMCDELGRQFSYSCPNTTLFQQRMLICDHWYMVNCSKAESDYAANLLIGQRDKPFVNDEENSLRTPRPDLLDRPYAPDYSGESYRNQYNKHPLQNEIADIEGIEKNINKLIEANEYPLGQKHWKIPPPSLTILPPAYEPRTEIETSTSVVMNASNARIDATPSTIKSTKSKTPTTTRVYPANKIAEVSLAASDDHDDLGTSHSTRYNTSADFNSADQRSLSKSSRRSFSRTTTVTAPTTTTSATTSSPPVKIPSKIYEPPYLEPIYNEQNSTTFTLHSATSTEAPSTTARVRFITTTTTNPPPSNPPSPPTTLAGKPFAKTSGVSPPFVAPPSLTVSATTLRQDRIAVRTPPPASGFKPSTNNGLASLSQVTSPKPPSNGQSSPNPLRRASAPNEPTRDLLPPYQEFVQHDIATTQGPPIYYEWKVPSNGLEPPKLDPPIGVDGREYPDADIDYNGIRSIVTTTPQTTIALENHDEATRVTSSKRPYQNNPFLPSTKSPTTAFKHTTTPPSSKTPVSRSVKDTAQPGTTAGISNVAKPVVKPSTIPINGSSNITRLRQDFSIPEFLFPLEDVGRTGYLATDTYNSFQLKIPEQRGDNEAESQHWFGENPKCPECHPSYVKPGTCEPCLRR